MRQRKIYTIGHSARSIEQFIGLLKAHSIKQVVDIRTIPRSRHNPQFNKDVLAKVVRNRGIGYRHMKELGGLRHAKKDSVNTGWLNMSFRGFADYMGSGAFREALDKLERVALKKRTTIMCAEAVPWRCHRSLVGDALTIDRWGVFHIISKRMARLHKLTPFLRIREGSIVYKDNKGEVRAFLQKTRRFV